MDVKEALKKYEDLMKAKTILKGVVKLVYFDEEYNTDVLVLDLDGLKGVIKKEDVDAELQISSLVNFVGREVSFIVKKVDKKKGVVECSRAEAQKATKEDILNRILDGEDFPAQIINILPYGAYVEIEGVTGLLKNTDFAEDYTTIGEMHKLGDRIRVRIKKLSSNKNLIFEAVNKYQSPTIMTIDMFERNQVVYGVVRSIQPFGVFVQIGPNLDALCSLDVGEIDEDMPVSVKITKVIKEEGKVRGKIVNVL